MVIFFNNIIVTKILVLLKCAVMRRNLKKKKRSFHEAEGSSVQSIYDWQVENKYILKTLLN